MGCGMAITSGVSMNGVPGGAIVLPARSLTIAPQPELAGDQITGCGPFDSGSGQPSTISWAAAPDALRAGRTNTQSPSASAPSPVLNSLASSVSSAIFSLLTAMSTTTQSPGSPSIPSIASGSPSP